MYKRPREGARAKAEVDDDAAATPLPRAIAKRAKLIPPEPELHQQAPVAAATEEEEDEAWLLNDPNLLSLVLDYSLLHRVHASRKAALDHPFRGLNRAARQAWLVHPISLAFSVRLRLAGHPHPVASLSLQHRPCFSQKETLMYMLDAAAQDFKQSVKAEQKQRKSHIECERGRQLLLKAVEVWVEDRLCSEECEDDEEEEAEDLEDRLRQEAQKLVEWATDIKVERLENCKKGTWSTQVRFTIEGTLFEHVEVCDEDQYCEENTTAPSPEELATLRETWPTQLDPDTLASLFDHLLHSTPFRGDY